ncbi:trk system potassium uptake protein TrkH [Aliiruegeria haliotis]|uniref:Trk system potassium uptake protein n=1 Tax=Aliiruegeria haliotis TaxID=1280846 RepID=A0A2T0RV14_9RHOB|nr:TrkH family potassium uptake protein [Aliiruegeria haliotis]PRY25035.1 trk system potassium uptake protein TrkH [Aliiruegeria haliotis]
MFDIRPVGYVIGLLVAALGATMLLPLLLDLLSDNGHWPVFLESAFITILFGSLLALSCQNAVGEGLTIQQTFLLTTGVWAALPLFGALPFVIGATDASFTDAYFEAMSGLTTTGATVFSGLDELPAGLLLWRSLLQWLGGIGIIVVAMVFLPELRVGGMQIFRSEAFDTLGKILPRAAEIASQITWIYVFLTVVTILLYAGLGMSFFDAVNHALTSISTGGFSTHDASFGAFQGAPEYAASVVMLLASLPFVRYIQLVNGSAKPMLRDSQIRTYLTIILVVAVVLALFQVFYDRRGIEPSIREALFNVTSIISGTGYASVDYQEWGTFAAMVFFFLGLIGGCAGSTACSVKIFRYQILFSAVVNQIKALHSPKGVFILRYDGRPIGDDVVNSVISFFVLFTVSLGLFAVALAMTGLDFTTSISGAAAGLANIGPGLGDTIGPSGNFSSLNATAKWIISAAMLIGRLELVAVYALLTAAFWRA